MRNSFCVIAALGLTLAAGGASAGTYDSSNSTAPGTAGSSPSTNPSDAGSIDSPAGTSTMPTGSPGNGTTDNSMGRDRTRMMEPNTINARTFKDADANRDGYIDSSEMMSVEGLSDDFSSADTNHDGKLSQSEFMVMKRPQ